MPVYGNILPMSLKKYWITPEQIRPLIPHHGGCIASDRITVHGRLVGHMYRELPTNDLDNGWRFLAGDESEDVMKDPAQHGYYDVNTIANLDTAIIPYLNAVFGGKRSSQAGLEKPIVLFRRTFWRKS